MITGLFHPVFYLPGQPCSDEEFALIAAHELWHLKSRDIWYKCLLLLVNGLYWFHPLIYLMRRKAGEALELCCDLKVTKGMPEEQKKAYASLLLSFMGKPFVSPAFSTCFGNAESTAKLRIANLLTTNKKKAGAFALALVLILAGIYLGLSIKKEVLSPEDTAREFLEIYYTSTDGGARFSRFRQAMEDAASSQRAEYNNATISNSLITLTEEQWRQAYGEYYDDFGPYVTPELFESMVANRYFLHMDMYTNETHMDFSPETLTLTEVPSSDGTQVQYRFEGWLTLHYPDGSYGGRVFSGHIGVDLTETPYKINYFRLHARP